MVRCPFCGWEGGEFYEHPKPTQRKNAFCPKCTSKERHRLLFLYMYDHGFFDRKLEILEVGPEYCWKRFLDKLPNMYYTSFDLKAPQATIKGNIEHTNLPSEIYDVIICYSVLEHVTDDFAAISELYRVLKHGATAFLHVPIKGAITDEDLTVTDKLEREKRFGQNDHVRYYGWDFIDRLVNAGFKVEVNYYAESIPEYIVHGLGILRDDFVIVAYKE
jgi:SAM-dependent methyltransferase